MCSSRSSFWLGKSGNWEVQGCCCEPHLQDMKKSWYRSSYARMVLSSDLKGLFILTHGLLVALCPWETLVSSFDLVMWFVPGMEGRFRQIQAELWATWSSCRCPCSLQGSWTRWPLKGLSNSSSSMILQTSSARGVVQRRTWSRTSAFLLPRKTLNLSSSHCWAQVVQFSCYRMDVGSLNEMILYYKSLVFC